MRSPLFERFLKETTSLRIVSWHYMEQKLWGHYSAEHLYRIHILINPKNQDQALANVNSVRARLCAGEECTDVDPGRRWPFESLKLEDLPQWLDNNHIEDGWRVMNKFFKWRLEKGV
jgi:hypothetical protein